MPPVVGLAPAHERVGVVGEPVDAVADRPDALAVDPAAEVGRRADVGRDGHDAVGDLGRLALEIDEEAPERLLGGLACRVCSRPSVGGHPRRLGDGGPARARRRRAAARAQLGLGRGVGEAAPTGRAGSVPSCAASSLELLVAEQRRVVGRVALGGQRPALDRVGEDDARAVADGVGLRGSRRSAPPGRGRRGRGRWRAARGRSRPETSTSEPLAQLAARRRAAGAGTPRWASRRCARAARGWAASRGAVLDHHAVPAGRLEHARQAPGGDVGHDAVQRLAVEVDHPHDLAELGHHRVGDRLPAGALVELGVADQRDLAAADRHVEVARPRSGGRARPRSARWRRARPSRSSSRPGRGPWCGWGRTAGRRTARSVVRYRRSSRPSR